MKLKRTLSLVLAFLMAVSVMAGCSGSSSSSTAAEGGDSGAASSSGTTSADSGEPVYGGTVVVAYTQEPDTMNVYSTHLLADVQTCMIEGLLIPDQDMNYVPVLAKEVPTVENGLIQLTDDGKMTITYNLKEGVKWHDGEPFTSADVKYTWEALYDENFIAEGKDGVYDIEKIECPDDYTVVCYYKYPVADYATTLFTFGILPKHVCEGTDLNEQTGYNVAPIGTGPYKFKEWKQGEYIELVANEDYHEEGKPYLDGIIFKMIPDANTQLTQFKTGEVNFLMNMPFDMYEELQTIEGTTVEAARQNAWTTIDFNLSDPIIGDKAVRQAISLCTNTDAIINQLFYGLPQACNSVWMPFDTYHNPDLPAHEYNPEKAAQILEEAGWVDTDGDGIREKDGQKLEIEFQARTDVDDDLKIQQVIMEECKQVGISMTADNAASATQSARWFDGDFQMNIHRWITGSPSRTRFYSANSIPPDGNNTVRYVNEELTQLLEESDQVLDVEQRKEMLYEAQEILLEDIPCYTVFNNVSILAHTDKLRGFVPNPTNMTNFWHVKDWWLAQ